MMYIIPISLRQFIRIQSMLSTSLSWNRKHMSQGQMQPALTGGAVNISGGVSWYHKYHKKIYINTIFETAYNDPSDNQARARHVKIRGLAQTLDVVCARAKKKGIN